MDYQVMALGIVFLALAYFVGVKKNTNLLRGFNQHRVRDKKKLAELIGSINFAVGVIFIVSGFIQVISLEILMPLVIVIYLLVMLYVNARMVE